MSPHTYTSLQRPIKYYPTLIHWISVAASQPVLLLPWLFVCMSVKKAKKWHVTFIRTICVSPKINFAPYKNGNEYKFSDLHELVLFHIPDSHWSFHPSLQLEPLLLLLLPCLSATQKDIPLYTAFVFNPLGNFHSKGHIPFDGPLDSLKEEQQQRIGSSFPESVRQQTHYGVYYKSEHTQREFSLNRGVGGMKVLPHIIIIDKASTKQ